MQTINHLSKILIFIALSCTFMIAWDSSSTSYVEMTTPDTYQPANNKPVIKHVAPTPTPAPAPAKKSSPIKTPIAKGSVWKSISNQFSLDHKTYTPEVQKQIRLLLSNRKHFNKILQAATPYIYYIFKQTQARGFPAEIALIPFIESEFSPYDRSSVGAAGLWQLMPGTARELGVKVRAGYDGRRNLVQSTKAALNYFKDLKKSFRGNWYLAIAAYNSGPGRINSASRRAGGSKNFFRLNTLPLETKLYVPKLLAVAEIIQHPAKYGIDMPKVSDSPYFSELPIEKNKSVNLNKLATTTGIDKKVLTQLNPDIKYGNALATTSKSILVPVKQTGTVKTSLGMALAKKPAINKQLKPHTAKKG